MSWFSRLVNRLLPDDPTPRCGYGPFSLPADSVLTPGCVLHDHAYSLSEQGVPEETLKEADIDLFRRWVFIAMNQPTIDQKLKAMEEVCEYWPYARTYGKYLWDGDPKVPPYEQSR